MTVFLKKTLIKFGYFASMVTEALTVIKIAIWTLQSIYTFIDSTKRVVTNTTKTSCLRLNAAFANSFGLMIWTFLVVSKTFAAI